MKHRFSALLNIWLISLPLTLTGCEETTIEKQHKEIAQQWSQMNKLFLQRSTLITDMTELLFDESDTISEALNEVKHSNAEFFTTQRMPDIMKDMHALQLRHTNEKKLNRDIKILILLLENPKYTSKTALTDLKNEFINLDKQIEAAQIEYDETIRIHNQTLKIFPHNFLASMLDYVELPNLTMDANSEYFKIPAEDPASRFLPSQIPIKMNLTNRD